jgi:hypothetical protein
MKPFDLEKALSGAKVVTRDGRKVTELHFFKNSDDSQPLLGMLEGDRDIFSWGINGKYNSPNVASFDLFMETKVIKGYVNVYEHESYNTIRLVTSSVYESMDIAKQNTNVNSQYPYIKTIEITNKP